MIRRRTRARRGRGLILTEACVSIALVALMLTVVSLLMTQYARSSDYFLNYRRAQLASESCVERLRSGETPLEDSSWSDDAGVTYSIHLLDAPNEWQPLKVVEVSASVVGKHSRVAEYKIRTAVNSARVGGRP